MKVSFDLFKKPSKAHFDVNFREGVERDSGFVYFNLSLRKGFSMAVDAREFVLISYYILWLLKIGG